MRKRLDFKIIGYDNQSRVGYKIFNCAEHDHRPVAWKPRMPRYRPTCGVLLRTVTEPNVPQVCTCGWAGWTENGTRGWTMVWCTSGSEVCGPCVPPDGTRTDRRAGSHGEATQAACSGGTDSMQPLEDTAWPSYKGGIPGWVARQVGLWTMAPAYPRVPGGRGLEEPCAASQNPQPAQGGIPAWKGRIGGSSPTVRNAAVAPLHQTPPQDDPTPRA